MDHLAMAYMGKSPNLKTARETYFSKETPEYVEE